MGVNIQMIIPVVLYLGLCLFVSLKIGNEQLNDTSLSDERKRFSNNFFVGGRSLGGFVLAMTVTATYFCASSYFGGPGIAYSKGLSWVYLAMIQVPLTFLILGTYGKKMGIISRKINAVTIPDYLRRRYKSELVVWIAAIAMIIFFTAIMVAQFMGGAILFQSMTGVSYVVGLGIFSIVVAIYTAVGGFKAVAIGDAIQGVVMLAGAIILLVSVVRVGGGMNNIKVTMDSVMPYWSEATAGGRQTKLYTMCFWMLIGYACVGLPQTAVRNMSFRDSKSVHDAMLISTMMMGALMLMTHFCGALSRAFISPDMVPTSDSVVPVVATLTMHPIIAGIFLAGCMAAVMSTVAGVLLGCTSSVVKDLWLHSKEEKEPDFLMINKNQDRYKLLSIIVTFIFGAIAVGIAVNPPSLITFLNLFATGGCEAVFLLPIIGGLYWKRSNKCGALAGSIGGFITFLLCKTVFAVSLGDIDASIPGVTVSLALFVIFTLLTKPDLNAEEMEVFFPTK